ncbi:hypothetical protein AALB51_16810 [Lachnospiraceae bacterium 62-26]
MTLQEFAGIIENSDEVRIIKDGKDIFTGWLAMLTMHNAMYTDIRNDKVKKFRAEPELRHRKWKELGLARPLQPDEAPDYNFSDLQMSLYYTIYL